MIETRFTQSLAALVLCGALPAAAEVPVPLTEAFAACTDPSASVALRLARLESAGWGVVEDGPMFRTLRYLSSAAISASVITTVRDDHVAALRAYLGKPHSNGNGSPVDFPAGRMPSVDEIEDAGQLNNVVLFSLSHPDVKAAVQLDITRFPKGGDEYWFVCHVLLADALNEVDRSELASNSGNLTLEREETDIEGLVVTYTYTRATRDRAPPLWIRTFAPETALDELAAAAGSATTLAAKVDTFVGSISMR